MNNPLTGIPAPTLSQQVAQIEWQRDQLNHIVGELVATCLLNLERGGLKCDDPNFRKFVEARSNLRSQVMTSEAAGCQTNAGLSVADSVQTGIGGVTAGETAVCYHASTRTEQGALVCNVCGETLAP